MQPTGKFQRTTQFVVLFLGVRQNHVKANFYELLVSVCVGFIEVAERVKYVFIVHHCQCNKMSAKFYRYVLEFLQVHPVGVSTIFANTQPTRNFLPIVRTGGSHGYHRLMKAKMSAEVDVLAKDSISVESADDGNGNASFSFLSGNSSFSFSLDQLFSVDDTNLI